MVTAIVIDDDVETAEVFAEYLAIKGIQVLEKGHSGLDAVNLYQKLKPDVVFLDVMMPEYDGFYALEKIKQADTNTKVIMITADSTVETAKRLKELNASAIIYKPYDIDKVIDIVSKLI